jgi:phosphate uptake regulator
MRRKLVKQGPASLTVSLPAAWVRLNQLKAGDEINITIEKNQVVVAPENREPEETIIAFDVRKYSIEYIRVLLSGLHKKGIDEITMQATQEQVAAIDERVTRHLMGYEVVQHKGEFVTIRSVMRADVDELATIVRRAFLVTLALAEGTNAEEPAADLILLEATNNRLTNYCERILVRNVAREESNIFAYIIVWLLEKIADEYRDIIKHKRANQHDAKICFQFLQQFYDLYYKFSYERHDTFVVELRSATELLAEKGSAFHPIAVLMRNTTGSLIGLNAQPTNRVGS